MIQPSSSRTVRIFISSTFRDFAEERDLLVRKVFPDLRRNEAAPVICSDVRFRGASFVGHSCVREVPGRKAPFRKYANSRKALSLRGHLRSWRPPFRSQDSLSGSGAA